MAGCTGVSAPQPSFALSPGSGVTSSSRSGKDQHGTITLSFPSLPNGTPGDRLMGVLTFGLAFRSAPVISCTSASSPSVLVSFVAQNVTTASFQLWADINDGTGPVTITVTYDLPDEKQNP